ncbi:TetR/AcrR family transcriptional regulator [Alkalihalophilus lindianensis]|uniref:TetR/AcrR family transcriptional regulator n=1 Tax=Alkalihalophilus lindianensis TaxID=1630542 RepID=A0ABU3XDW6_9BACI|nr:TetR/AcrR family transcriptional regulator [Alkalihalophilus lindianensis]MDV2686082.1 TetR/AcrR family transcriptional regulator [Alkalihalophilus lindianensis]
MKLSEKKALKKKEEIILSAVKIMNRKGYHGATMEDIAAELLMTKGALYYYFRNKEDIIFKCHELVLTRAIEELETYLYEDSTNEEKLRKMIYTHIDYAIGEKETFNMISKPDHTFSKEQLKPILSKRIAYASVFDRVIQQGIESKEFTVDEPKFVRMILLGAMNWIQQWYNAEGGKSIEELQKIYADYLLKVVK